MQKRSAKLPKTTARDTELVKRVDRSQVCTFSRPLSFGCMHCDCVIECSVFHVSLLRTLSRATWCGACLVRSGALEFLHKVRRGNNEVRKNVAHQRPTAEAAAPPTHTSACSVASRVLGTSRFSTGVELVGTVNAENMWIEVCCKKKSGRKRVLWRMLSESKKV
jgi:hypothetical protein